MKRLTGIIGSLWGVAGVLLLLGAAVYRLGIRAAEAFAIPWTPLQWVVFIAVLGVMAYSEGYRGFYRSFSPRVAARARHLRDHPVLGHVVFAPLFCMGYIHATRRRQMISLLMTIGIIGLVLLVRLLSQPWRGIVDAGVVVGLACGIVSVLWFASRTLTSADFDYPTDVP